jgi:hypothetical protein
MKIVSKSGTSERTVLIGMIVSTEVVGKIAQRWETEGLFASQWANKVGGWCVKHYKAHNEAPGKLIDIIFRKWAEKSDDDMVKLVEKFISSLGGEYGKLRKTMKSGFVMEEADKLFTRVKLDKVRRDIEENLEIGKIDLAEKSIAQYHKVELKKGSVISPALNISAMEKALDPNAQKVLIRYPGALGEFFGSALAEECFIAFMGPEKRGKSFVLMDLAFRAFMQRNRVAYFEAGDLSEAQVLRRFYTRAIGRPLRATREDKPVRYPKELIAHPSLEQDNSVRYEVKFDNRHYPKGVRLNGLKQAMVKIQKEKLKSDEDFFRLSVHPNSTLTVSGIRSILRDWYTYDRWAPKVIVVDYADILAAPPGYRGESRDAINENWKALRRMSQEQQCLVAVATQANAASYTAGTLGMENFSEDKRKFAHVTAMVGLNQIEMEKKESVQRWNWLVLREEEFFTSDSVVVAQCLGIANPCVRSAK